MRRRLDLAASLTGRPPVLLLDEPTTGLDPRSRWSCGRSSTSFATAGTTVLLTTQYLDEADRLAQRIAVIDAGKVIAEGTPAELKAGAGTGRAGGSAWHDPAGLATAALLLADLAAAGTSPAVDHPTGELTVRVARPDASAAAVRRLDGEGLHASMIQLTQPSLDDVFLSLTGHTASTPEAEAEAAAKAAATSPEVPA